MDSRAKPSRIEWTGAGGDYYLAVAIDVHSEIIGEFWGTEDKVRNWMKTQWPRLPATFVPMALGATRRRERRAVAPVKRKAATFLTIR